MAQYLIDSHKDMAMLERAAQTVRRSGADNAEDQALLAEWDAVFDQWVAQTLPSLMAAMGLALEVLETFGAGMTLVDDPVERVS